MTIFEFIRIFVLIRARRAKHVAALQTEEETLILTEHRLNQHAISLNHLEQVDDIKVFIELIDALFQVEVLLRYFLELTTTKATQAAELIADS